MQKLEGGDCLDGIISGLAKPNSAVMKPGTKIAQLGRKDSFVWANCGDANKEVL